MRKIIIFVCFVNLFASSILFAQVGEPSREETEKNIKILQSIFKDQNTKPTNAQLYEASQAILKLTQTGTDDAATELGKLLAIEELNTAVCTALVNLGNAGINELREALNLLEGKNLAGVIDSLGSIRDEKSVGKLINLTEHKNELIVKSSIFALGKIAVPDTTRKLSAILSDDKNQFRETAANSLLYAAEQLHSNGNLNAALELLKELRKHKELSATWAAATQTYCILNEKEGIDIFDVLLRSNDVISFQTARNIALKLKSPCVVKLIVGYLEKADVSANQQMLLIETLGVIRDRSTLPVLIKFADSKDTTVRIAAIKVLGKIGDMSGFDVIFAAINSQDNDIATTAKDSLTKLQGKEFNSIIIQNLNSKNKTFRLTALNVIAERRITEARENVQLLFDDLDVEIRVAAYRGFAQVIVAVPSDLELLLVLLAKINNNSEEEKNSLRNALIMICRQISARDESVDVIKRFQNGIDVQTKLFLIDLLYYIGNAKAVKLVAEFARDKELIIVDHATMILGKWSTSEVAPYLIELAENHPLEKYRFRTLSGYIRVIRQFGLPLEQKFEMIQKAELIAKREADKTRIAEIKAKIQTQLHAKPIFDGKTFDGWEGNLDYFRIKDGAIVAGTFEKPIPRNEFLCTKKEYGNFTLHLEIKVLGNGANAGVQFRSKRLTEDKKRPNEVSGYQADMTETAKFWGCLYDEARRRKFLAEADFEEVKKIFRPNDWNELKIVCQDNNIKIYVNGKLTTNYTETDENIQKTGIIGLQIHAGNPSEAWYRNIRIE
ncbi:MAG: DUF1080 domain-containing protein [Planctomycetaceae bacterium]|jgi:HEAT repeat protein|nr:DUF1080 domain-containing protein [Planctomycetaceae bacterium]